MSVLLLTKYKICAGLPRNIMAGYEEDELHCCHPGTLAFMSETIRKLSPMKPFIMAVSAVRAALWREVLMIPGRSSYD